MKKMDEIQETKIEFGLRTFPLSFLVLKCARHSIDDSKKAMK